LRRTRLSSAVAATLALNERRVERFERSIPSGPGKTLSVRNVDFRPSSCLIRGEAVMAWRIKPHKKNGLRGSPARPSAVADSAAREPVCPAWQGPSWVNPRENPGGDHLARWLSAAGRGSTIRQVGARRVQCPPRRGLPLLGSALRCHLLGAGRDRAGAPPTTNGVSSTGAGGGRFGDLVGCGPNGS